MATNKHIEHILDTEANIRINIDLAQIAIQTDQGEELIWSNFDNSKQFYTAPQYYWNGAAVVYCDVDFNVVTAHSDILLDEYIKRAAGVDDSIRFEDDKITIAAGGVNSVIIEDDAVYTLNLGVAKTTLESWDSLYRAIEIGGGTAILGRSTEVAGMGSWFLNNTYYDGDWKRKVDDEACFIQLINGAISWYSDVSGTPDIAFTPTERIHLSNTGNFGINEVAPETIIELTNDEPYFTFHNDTEEDGDNGRESKLIFKGEKADTTEHELSVIEVGHDGAGDDTNGKITISINDGSSVVDALTINSSINASLGGSTFDATATNTLFLQEGTAPAGGLANNGALWAQDDTGTSEVYVQDSAGNQTKISPHNQKGEWVFQSKNVNTEKGILINMINVIKEVEKLSKKKFIFKI